MPTSDDHTPRAEWVAVASYSTGLEADIARNALEQEDIPVLVHSNAPGIFGLAFQGVVAGGITLHVPTPELDRAHGILRAHAARHLTLLDDDESRAS